MISIHQLDKSEFNKKKFKYLIGDEDSYSLYYDINYRDEKINISIGLVTLNTGINPQVCSINNHIVIGAYKKIFIYDIYNDTHNSYDLIAPFYEFYLIKNSIVVIYELGVIVLGYDFRKRWGKTFHEIIDVENIDDASIQLKDFNGNIIRIDVLTGEYI